jgi:hypothetical protein
MEAAVTKRQGIIYYQTNNNKRTLFTQTGLIGYITKAEAG